MEQFQSESEQNPEEREWFLERMAWFNLRDQSPGKFGPLLPSESSQLKQFRKTASEADRAILDLRTEMKRKTILYSDRNTPRRDLERIEDDMAADKKLREYIETSWLRLLVNNYLVWKGTPVNWLDSRQSKQTEMTSREIKKLFEYAQKYPGIVEEAILGAYTEQSKNYEEDPKTDLSAAHEEINSFRNLSNYLFEKASKLERDDAVAKILENDALQKIVAVLKKPEQV